MCIGLERALGHMIQELAKDGDAVRSARYTIRGETTKYKRIEGACRG